MSHVSRKKLDPKVLARTHDAFLSIIEGGSARERKSLLACLLTSTELTMLAKRLVAIRMLAEDTSYFRVAEELGMSTSTLRRFYQLVQNGEHAPIVAQIAKRKASEKFWKTLEVAFRGGLPSMGRD